MFWLHNPKNFTLGFLVRTYGTINKYVKLDCDYDIERVRLKEFAYLDPDPS